MDSQRWTAEQRKLRELMRSQRHGHDRGARLAGAAAASPLASVIVVCWNSADVLGRCLDQLLAQDYANYELVVVDDGSQDDTLAIARRAAARGAVHVVRSPLNCGCPHARNLGLERARGEIVAFVDADGFAAVDWLSNVVAAFDAGPDVGGVASTVFYADNPLVINGAGGTVNRQGWSADLSMNEPYETAELADEALYPMGCGMAFRRAALERAGPFDDRMVNYYDDVDYGIRLWRAGYRVVVAPDAWVDHGLSGADAETERRRLLCERHRVRVVLKHASVRSLGRWAVHEAWATLRADTRRRRVKLRAMAWNARNLASTLAERRRLRHLTAQVPAQLVDRSWGDRFPAGLPPRRTPRPQSASNVLDMAEARSEEQLLYGWFTLERPGGRAQRWTGVHAGALMRLQAPTSWLVLSYSNAPVDTGGIDLRIRRPDAAEPLLDVWSAHLPWRAMEHCRERHPVALTTGDYEVLFSVRRGWSDPPRDTRSLGFALERMCFEESYEIPTGGVDMSSPAASGQLVCGWFAAEDDHGREFRWASAHAAVLVRLEREAGSALLTYRFPPGPNERVAVSARPLGAREAVWSTELVRRAPDWQEQTLALHLAAGEYVVSFDAPTTWSNPDRRDSGERADGRELGLAVAALAFG
ncbi:MAG TPA: glycosyltransferase family 2 protein [Solirubrobacteraceae bacterium]|nr:glycosyltransferase family 2 protein [Solirubrobacteraceae bacterium]